MIIIPKRHIILMLLLLIVTFPFSANAYTCWKESAPQQVRDAADYVFTGKVVDIATWEESKKELNSVRQNITFSIQRSWKGIAEGKQSIKADVETVYQHDFQVGESYLIYGYNLYKKRVSIVGCPRVKTIAQAVGDIYALDQQNVQTIATYSKKKVEKASEPKTKDGLPDVIAEQTQEIQERFGSLSTEGKRIVLLMEKTQMVKMLGAPDMLWEKVQAEIEVQAEKSLAEALLEDEPSEEEFFEGAGE